MCAKIEVSWVGRRATTIVYSSVRAIEEGSLVGTCAINIAVAEYSS